MGFIGLPEAAVRDAARCGPQGADADVTEATDALRATLQRLTDDLQANYPVDGAGQWWHPARLGGTAPTVAETAHEQRGSRRPDGTAG